MASLAVVQKSETINIEAPAKKELTAKEKKSLFENYEKLNSEVERVERELEKATENRSNQVMKIADALGKGPFLYKGKKLTPVVRTSKLGNTSAYFRGDNEREVEEI